MSMNVVLVHPDHGAKIAIHPKELEADLANGWSKWVAPIVETVQAVESVVETVGEVLEAIESVVKPIEVPVIDVNALLAKSNTAPKSKK